MLLIYLPRSCLSNVELFGFLVENPAAVDTFDHHSGTSLKSVPPEDWVGDPDPRDCNPDVDLGVD